MYITGIQIDNYKSYLSSDKIPLTKGFNVIVGANNVGKTALLESLSWAAIDIPHRSNTSSRTNQNYSKAKIWVGLNKQEIFEHFGRSTLLSVPQPLYLAKDKRTDFISRVIRVLQDSFEIQVEYRFGNRSYTNNGYLVHKTLQDISGIESANFITFQLEDNHRITHNPAVGSGNIDFANSLAKSFVKFVYFFNAERRISAKGLVNLTQTLNSDASNLVSVLHDLYNRNNARFQKLFQVFKKIFPEIHGITMPTTGTSAEIVDGETRNNSATIELMLWNEDPSLERPDLAFSLADSGTGIGQVLAMLYVVFTATKPLTLLIDEPQSFLHPSAIRKLFEIFKEHPQHQYIVTTHSPTVIAAADPDNILLIHKEGSESKVQQIKKEEKQDMERVLHSVGASLSDVFGADSILWVEGETEEKCFSLILREIKKRSLFGMIIKNVVNTGDFVTKKKKSLDLIKQIYDRLSKNVALMPAAVGFIFDNEGLNPTDIEDIERLYKDEQGIKRLVFIPRTMYENYLLNDEAIAHIMSQELGLSFSAQDVKDWLTKNQKGSIKTLDGAKLIKRLFSELSDSKLEYDKIRHGYQLTQWLIENNCLDDLQELANFLDEQIEIWINKAQP